MLLLMRINIKWCVFDIYTYTLSGSLSQRWPYCLSCFPQNLCLSFQKLKTTRLGSDVIPLNPATRWRLTSQILKFYVSLNATRHHLSLRPLNRGHKRDINRFLQKQVFYLLKTVTKMKPASFPAHAWSKTT